VGSLVALVLTCWLSSADSLGRITRYEYDNFGRRIFRKLPGEQIEKLAYDPPNASTILNQQTRTDFNGRTTILDFDVRGRLFKKTPDAAFNAVPIEFTYTPWGARRTMNDPSGTTTYIYGRLQVDGSGNITSHTYDSDRLLVKHHSQLGAITYDYNSRGGLTRIDSRRIYTTPTLAGGTDTYQISASGTDPTRTLLTYEYDFQNRLQKVWQSGTQVAEYSYKDQGLLETVSYPAAAGVAHNFTYGPQQALTDLTVVRGVTTLATFGYNPGQRPIKRSGLRQAARENFYAGNTLTRSVDYTFDSLNRLTKETINTDPGSYTGTIDYGSLGKVGNRPQRQVANGSGSSLSTKVAPVASYAYDHNDWLDTDTDPANANGDYDANGNTLFGDLDGDGFNDQSQTDVYDFEDRLVQTIRDNGATTIALTYDGDGQRVKKTAGSTTTWYLVDDRNPTGYAQVLEEWTSTEPTPSGLIGRWRFEEGAGTTAADDHGTANNGTLLNGPVWSSGPMGGALKFDGVNDYVSVADAAELRLGTGMTIALWVKKEAEASDWVRLVGKGDSANRNYGVWEESGSGKRILFQFQKTDGTWLSLYSTATLEVGQWYHVTCTYNGSTAVIYLNGTAAGQQAITGTPKTSSHPVTFGYAGFHTYLAGCLDEVRIYNRALSAGEVSALAGSSAQYVYGLDLVSQKRNPSSLSPLTSYFVYDALGSVRALANTAGDLTDTYTYDAYGLLIERRVRDGSGQLVPEGSPGAPAPTVNWYRFTGEQWDADLGMYHLRARYLNPQSGRFWSMDTFEGNQSDPLSLHKYLYAHADPVNNIDPSGNESLIGISLAGTLGQGLHGKYDAGVSTVGNSLKNTIIGVYSGMSVGQIVALNFLDNAGGVILGKAIGSLSQLRRLPGVVKGVGKVVERGRWLRGSHGNAGHIPEQIAKQLAGRKFANFDEFRETFWRLVADDAELAANFSAQNVARIGQIQITRQSRRSFDSTGFTGSIVCCSSRGPNGHLDVQGTNTPRVAACDDATGSRCKPGAVCSRR
jgi:RHS repeat-associated protein